MQPALVVNHSAGSNADHHIVRLVMRSLQKMDVVGRNKGNAKSLRHLDQGPVAQMLRFDPVIVQLEVEVFIAKKVTKFASRSFCLFQIPGEDCDVDFSLETSATADQPGTV